MSPAVIAPVNVEVPLTANVSVVVASAVNPFVTVAQSVTVAVQIVALVEFKFVMFHCVADNVQETDKSDSAATFQLSVDVQLTANACVFAVVAVMSVTVITPILALSPLREWISQ